MRAIRRIVFMAAAILAAGIGTASGQGLNTADQTAQIHFFGGWSYSNPDYGVSSFNPGSHNSGFTTGAEFSLRPLWFRLSPGLEVRMLRTTGPIVDQRNYAGGLRLQLHSGRIQPYTGFLMGYGILHYPVPFVDQFGHSYTGDNAITKNIPLGADMLVTPHWALQGEVLKQWWNTDPGRFQPWAVTVGVRYRPFAATGPR